MFEAQIAGLRNLFSSSSGGEAPPPDDLPATQSSLVTATPETGFKFAPGKDFNDQQWMGMSPDLARYVNAIQTGKTKLVKKIVAVEDGEMEQNQLLDAAGNQIGALQDVPGRDDIKSVKAYNQQAGGFHTLYVYVDPKTGQVAPVQNFTDQVTYGAPSGGMFFDQVAQAAKMAAPYAALLFGGPLAAELGGGLVGAAGSSAIFQAAGGTPVDKIAENIAKGAAIGGVVGADGLDVAGNAGGGVAGQLAQNTAANLISGQNLENAVTGAVKSTSIGSLTSSSVPADTTAFDTTTDISDTSGFNATEPSTSITPISTNQITGNTGGNMVTDYTEDPYGYSGTPSYYNYTEDPYGYTGTPPTDYTQDPYGYTGGTGGSQVSTTPGDYLNTPSGYGNLTIGQVQRLLGGGGGTASRTQQSTTQSLLQRLLGGATGRQPSLQLGGAASQLGNLLGGAVSGAGGILAGQTAAKASEEQARMISQATGQAVGGSQFRPIGTTTRYGTSQFQVDPITGQLTSAGYQLSPELKAMQDRVMALTGKGLTEAELAGDRYSPLTAGAQGLFGLGQQYLAQSPQQVAADYMAKQQDLLAPSRERQLAQLQTQLFNTGRGGLSVGGTGVRPGGGQGLRAASPEMEAYYNALAQQDAQLAAGAQQAGQQQVQFGAGLMGTGANLLGAYGQGLTGAYAPFSTGIGVGSSLEQLGQQPLSLSQQLAQLSSTAGARAGELGIRGTTAASVARLPSMQYNPLSRALVGAGGNTQFGGALGDLIGGAFPGLFGTGTTINPMLPDEFGYQPGFSEMKEYPLQDSAIPNLTKWTTLYSDPTTGVASI